MRNDVILVLVVITALSFDFTNGFHDTGNAMATSIATGALSPRVAVALSGLLNLVGAFLSLAVAAASAWLLTLPCSAAVGAGAYALARAVGGSVGVIIILIILAALVAFIYWRSRGSKVDHNVNAEWTGTVVPAEHEPATAACATGNQTMSWINLSAIWRIVVFGLIAGAGLPALFAVGMVSLARGPKTQTAGGDSEAVVGGSPVGTAIAAVCFLIVLAAIGWGIYEIYKIGHPAPAPPAR